VFSVKIPFKQTQTGLLTALNCSLCYNLHLLNAFVYFDFFKHIFLSLLQLYNYSTQVLDKCVSLDQLDNCESNGFSNEATCVNQYDTSGSSCTFVAGAIVQSLPSSSLILTGTAAEVTEIMVSIQSDAVSKCSCNYR
jgi:hypothetical protein